MVILDIKVHINSIETVSHGEIQTVVTAVLVNSMLQYFIVDTAQYLIQDEIGY